MGEKEELMAKLNDLWSRMAPIYNELFELSQRVWDETPNAIHWADIAIASDMVEEAMNFVTEAQDDVRMFWGMW